MRISKFEAFMSRVTQAVGINTQTELAAALRINRSAITQARKKDAIPDRWILQLYRSFGMNPDWIETGNGPTFIKARNESSLSFKQIPKVKARLSAGGGSFETGTEIEGYYSFQRKWLNMRGVADRMVLMDIFGNSMEPELKAGDTVLIDESQKDILAGAFYAVGVHDTIMVKRLEKHPHKLVLISDNQDYAPVYLEGHEIDTVRVIGKVIWVCREYK